MPEFEVLFDISSLEYTVEAKDKHEAVQIAKDLADRDLPDRLEIVNILVNLEEY